jgi:hypothetical protein
VTGEAKILPLSFPAETAGFATDAQSAFDSLQDKKPAPTHAVAVVGDAVTEDELNAAIDNKLMRVKAEEYNARRASLDEIIANRLLRNEAAKRHETVDDLLHTEVDSKVSVPAAASLSRSFARPRE